MQKAGTGKNGAGNQIENTIGITREIGIFM